MKKYILLFLLVSSYVSFSQVSITWPLNKTVFQRDLNNANGKSVVWLAGFCSNWQTGYQLQYRVMSLDAGGNEQSTPYINWTNIPSPTQGRTFILKLTRNAEVNVKTGWYRVDVKLMNGTSQIAIANSKFGVGEVFVIAGQSNALGEENTANQNADTYDCVIASAQTSSNKCSNTLPVYPGFYSLGYTTTSKISPNGDLPWVYKMLGKKIVDMDLPIVTPVMFFNTAMSGSQISQWANSVDNPSGSFDIDPFSIDRCPNNVGSGGVGEPYRSLRNTLNFYGSLFGVRGVIWHQGESDTKQGTINTYYTSKLDILINATRTNFNNNLAWAVSNVSRICDNCSNDGQVSSGVLNGQGQTRNNVSAVIGAGNSDNYYYSAIIPANNPYKNTSPNYRMGSRTHFSNSGLYALSEDYFPNIKNSLLIKTPVNANTIIPITITQTGTSAIINVDFGAVGMNSSNFQCFQWVSGLYPPTYSNATYPPTNCSNYQSKQITQSGYWMCYMQDNKGNVYVTPNLYINVNSGARLANSTVNSSFFPNPTKTGFENIISFELEEPAMVKLEIIDEKGVIVKTLTDKLHGLGKYEYSFNLGRTKQISEIVYYRLNINNFSETKRILLIEE